MRMDLYKKNIRTIITKGASVRCSTLTLVVGCLNKGNFVLTHCAFLGYLLPSPAPDLEETKVAVVI